MRILFTIIALLMFAGSAEAAARSDLFPQPPEISPAVNFWTRVYTEINTGEGFIHDLRHLDVVYEVLKLPKNSSRKARSRAMEKAKDRYAKILRSLAKGKRSNLTAEAARVLALWPEGVSKKTLRNAARQLRFQQGQANKFRDGLIRSGAWMPHIRKTLAERGLPHEIAALPHVESSFNPEAASHAGAAGLWQFTRSTGRRFMRIDHVVDQRRDPYMSTIAAAQLLEQNYATLGHWPLAMTAYNHGVAGMRRAVRRLKTHRIDTIIERYRSRTFGFASRNFYPAFLAAVRVTDNANAYFGHLDHAIPVETTTVKVPEYLHVNTVGSVFDIDAATLKRYNPALKKPVWTGKKYVPRGFELRLPTSFLSGDPEIILANIPQDKRFVKQQRDRYHKVRRGDTLSTIATRYGIRLTELVSFNGLNRRKPIYPGQRIQLPGTDVPTRQITPITRQTIPDDGEYVVRRGDSIHRITQRFGVDEKTLLALNPMRNRHQLEIGQVLRLMPVVTDQPETVVVALAEPETLEPKAASPTMTITRLNEPRPQPQDVVEELDENVLAATQVTLSADPSDYTAAGDETIEVQARETLGHYADWLGVPTQRLRNLNHMGFGEHVVIGERLRLEFSRVDDETFEQRRLAYHQELQERFFDQYHIEGTDTHIVRRGESIWTMSREKYHVPVWLLRQYNPDLAFDQMHPGTLVKIPKLTRVTNGEAG